ncbi:MAG: cytochrome b5 domain-containing protein [Dethiobacteria bacterium]|nr:cytochrome b5 domain-containing protein [Dethiobacteria bacterium]
MFNNKLYALFLVSLLCAFFLVAGCGSSTSTIPEEVPEDTPPTAVEEVEEESEEAAEETTGATFSMEEIALFDGKDGRPAYIVVDGVVYDVSSVRQWNVGSHFGFEAGTDVTEALQKSAPHGVNQLNQAEIVGTIAE